MKFLIILSLITMGVILVEGKTEHPVETPGEGELLDSLVECYQREKCHEQSDDAACRSNCLEKAKTSV